MKRVQFKVHGTVQGVNFRYFTKLKGNSLQVTGFVRNDNDGTVSGEAQGTEDNLKEFFELVNKGPPHASVTKLDKTEIDKKDGEKGFEQIR